MNKSEATVIYDNDEEPIIFSKSLSDIFIKSEHPDQLMALYWFYYYTAKWQKTNQPYALDIYVKQCLKWGQDKLHYAKSKLKEMGLIETIRKTNKKGQVERYYIKVNFIWGKEKSIKTQSSQKPIVGLPNSGFQDTSALSANTESALSSNKEMLKVNSDPNGSPKKPNPIHTLITVFSELYMIKYGNKYIASKADYGIVKNLCGAGETPENIERKMRAAFGAKDLWFITGPKAGLFTIGAFRGKYNDIPLEEKNNDAVDKFIRSLT